MHYETIASLQKKLHAKEMSSVELTQHYLGRIQRFNGELNAYVTVTEENALQEAKAADALISAGKAGPLTGIPIAHKDNFSVKNVRLTCGSKMLENFIAPYESTVTQRLQNAGMVSLGKLNMDEFAMGSSNENSYFGPVKNPWNTNHVPGGSSGGSSTTVASALAPAATGSDTGGSIRQPAAFTGITGLKPTYGRISRYGMVAFASSLDQAGPMTRTAEDAAMLMNALAGLDEKDPSTVDEPVPDYTATLNQSVKGLKIGLPVEFFSEHLDPVIAKPILAAVAELEKQGAIIKDLHLPVSALSIPVYYIIAPAECSSNLSRFDGVRYGYRCEDPKNLEDLYLRSRAEGFGKEVKRRIIIGTYALSSGHYDAYYAKAQKLRRLIKNEFVRAFEEVDIIAGPTTPSTAFKIGEKCNDPVAMYLADAYTIATNLAGIPGISIPAGFHEGLPIGLQLMGNYFSEAKLLNVAHQYQQLTDWHQRLPEKFSK